MQLHHSAQIDAEDLEKLSFPEVFPVSHPVEALKAGIPFQQLKQHLLSGRYLLAGDTYATTLAFYSWLKKENAARRPIHDFHSARRNKEKLSELTQLLLIPVADGHVQLRGAPENLWLKSFYPAQQSFLMRFTDFLGLNGAWQWFQKGILFPGLKRRIHPFYGVYFPTRTEHLQLFDQWLSRQAAFENAVDTGTGCGVLTHYLLKHGCRKITATDINPNALYSVKKDFEHQALQMNVVLKHGSLFDPLDEVNQQLFVFNPPWIPATSTNSLDRATHYDDGFFTGFFDQAAARIKSGSLLVLFFSNFAQVAGLTQRHPFVEELGLQRFELVEKLEQPLHQPPSARKDWLSAIRQREKNELWVLKKV